MSDDSPDDDVFLCALQCINCCSVVQNCTPKYSCSGLYGTQQRISGERSVSRGCRYWQSMCWKDQLQRSGP
ncbi:unnamed protein product [Sphagnum jensenii]|uniref:Uncharacterized protein n=1 Tax=Sphagnum jensenii TaxID=128206 RepID=A0ABP0WV46_9BRYO